MTRSGEELAYIYLGDVSEVTSVKLWQWLHFRLFLRIYEGKFVQLGVTKAADASSTEKQECIEQICAVRIELLH